MNLLLSSFKEFSKWVNSSQRRLLKDKLARDPTFGGQELL